MRLITSNYLLKISILSLSMLVTATMLISQERSYGLNELIELGIKHSVGRQTEELRLENSKSSLRTSYLDFLPSASVHVSREYLDDGRTTAGFSLSKGLSLNEPSYFNWRRSKLDWGNALLSYQENKKTTVFEIFMRYIRVAEAQQRVEIQTQNLAIQQRIMEQMELLHRLEQRSMIELKQTEIALINARIALEDSELQLKNNRESLFLYLNIDDLGYPLEEINVPITDEYPEYRETVELEIAANNLQRTNVSLTQSRLNFLPNLSLNYAYNTRKEDDILEFGDYRDSYTLSLSASYSLFNYVEHREQHNRNKREKMIQELNLLDTEKNIKNRYEQMIRGLNREQRIYELAERRKELAEETLELARTRFNLGMLSLLELEQAMKEHYEAAIEVSTRYYQILLKQEELNLLLSEPILGEW